MMNHNEVARGITELHDSIVGTIIVKKGNLLGAYARPKVPIPQMERFSDMFLQAELMVSIPTKNADVFGEVKFVTVQHDILHIFMFLLPDKTVLAFAVDSNIGYDYKKLTSTVLQFIEEKIED